MKVGGQRLRLQQPAADWLRLWSLQVIPKTRGKQHRDKVLKKIAAEADFLLRAQESMGVVQVGVAVVPP